MEATIARVAILCRVSILEDGWRWSCSQVGHPSKLTKVVPSLMQRPQHRNPKP